MRTGCAGGAHDIASPLVRTAHPTVGRIYGASNDTDLICAQSAWPAWMPN